MLLAIGYRLFVNVLSALMLLLLLLMLLLVVCYCDIGYDSDVCCGCFAIVEVIAVAGST